MDLLGGGRGPGAARRAPPPAPPPPRRAGGAGPPPPEGPARARLRPGALLLDPHHPPLRGFLPDAARPPRLAPFNTAWRKTSWPRAAYHAPLNRGTPLPRASTRLSFRALDCLGGEESQTEPLAQFEILRFAQDD